MLDRVPNPVDMSAIHFKSAPVRGVTTYRLYQGELVLWSGNKNDKDKAMISLLLAYGEQQQKQVETLAGVITDLSQIVANHITTPHPKPRKKAKKKTPKTSQDTT